MPISIPPEGLGEAPARARRRRAGGRGGFRGALERRGRALLVRVREEPEAERALLPPVPVPRHRLRQRADLHPVFFFNLIYLSIQEVVQIQIIKAQLLNLSRIGTSVKSRVDHRCAIRLEHMRKK